MTFCYNVCGDAMFSNFLILQILDYLDLNLYKKISIDELVDIFHYDKAYMMRLFKKELGITIVEYLNDKKVFSSLKALQNNHSSILSVALDYGFFSQEYFCEIFHKVIGVSPTNYRLFLTKSYLLQEKDIFSIQENITYLNSLFKQIDNYHNNVPTNDSIKILSIFKK